MKMKSFVFFAAMALVLVGCNKEKEESMENPAVSTEQQQALPVVSNNAVPAAPPAASMPEQGNVNVIGQQAATPQTPQEAAAAVPIQQAAPTADLQNQVQPVRAVQPDQPIQPSQLVQAAPVASVTPEPVVPASSVPVAIPPAAQPVVPQSTMVVADKLAPTQNAPSHTIVVPAPDASVSTGTAGAAGQATDVVGTKVSYRKSATISDAKAKHDTGSSGSNAVPTTTTTTNTPNTLAPSDDDED